MNTHLSPDRLLVLPNSKEELLVFMLENHKSSSMVGVLRWVFKWIDAGGPSGYTIVERRMALWIEDNWDWAVGDFNFGNDDTLHIKFSMNGIVLGNSWTVEYKKTKLPEEERLYNLAKAKADAL